jgi:hypothetical protein
MPQVSNVQILQGPQEKGKDLIFFTPGLTSPILNACVVKNSKISGNVSSSHGARTVFHQAEQAIDTDHLDENGRSISVSKVYVMTPHTISQEAISSIVGALKRSQGVIEFVAGPQLFELFRTHYDDYLSEEYAFLSREFDDVLSSLDHPTDLRALQDHFKLTPSEKSLKAIYVRPELHKRLQSCTLFPQATVFEQATETTFVNKAGLTSKTKLRQLLYLLEELATITDFMGVMNRSLEQRLRDLLGSTQPVLQSLTTEVELERGFPDEDMAYRLANKSPLIRLGVLLGTEAPRLIKDIEKEFTRVGKRLNSISNPMLCDIEEQLRKTSDSLHYLSTLSTFTKPSRELSIDLSESELLTIRKPILIVAPAGYGKSSFCRWHALKNLEDLATGNSSIVPVFVPLYQLREANEISVEGSFLRYAGRSVLTSAVKKRSATQPLRLYLDGLDEVPDDTVKMKIIAAAMEASMLPNCNVIITSRDYISLPLLAECERIALKGFNDTQIQELIRNWLGKDEPRCERFERLIVHSTLYELMRIPLLATLTLLTFSQTNRLPESKILLYEDFTDLLNGGWDLVKGVQRQLVHEAGEKEYFLKSLALHMHRAGKREMAVNEARLVFNKVFGEKSTFDELVSEMLIDSLLTRAGNSLEFAHLSFQEFFTAKALIGQLDQLLLDDVKRHYLGGSDWWKEVLVFYAGCTGRPLQFLEWFGQSGHVRVQSLKRDVMQLFPYLQ